MIVALTMIGLIATIAFAAVQWQKRIYRLLPFLYATASSLVFFGNKPFWDLLVGVLAMNAATGIVMFAVWFEGIRGRKNK